MAVERVIRAVHPVRRPSGVGLDAHDAQLGMTLEHAAEDERAHDVLAPADDAEEAVHLGSAELRPVAMSSLPLVRMWNDSGIPRSTAACHSGSHRGSS